MSWKKAEDLGFFFTILNSITLIACNNFILFTFIHFRYFLSDLLFVVDFFFQVFVTLHIFSNTKLGIFCSKIFFKLICLLKLDFPLLITCPHFMYVFTRQKLRSNWVEKEKVERSQFSHLSLKRVFLFFLCVQLLGSFTITSTTCNWYSFFTERLFRVCALPFSTRYFVFWA
jgi:hypothetical protein